MFVAVSGEYLAASRWRRQGSGHQCLAIEPHPDYFAHGNIGHEHLPPATEPSQVTSLAEL
jgi:hypothetical protein